MTDDMQREAFELKFRIDASERRGEVYSTVNKTRLWITWKDGYACAIRHMREQSRKCECAYKCKFCRDREQEDKV